jgi:hydroxyethylthiazole kinase
MVSLAGALVLNIGTLSDDWIESMLVAGKKAAELGTPVILDPVGAGATHLRTASARKILDEIHIHVLRGNASEILSLRHQDSQTKGVDSVHTVDDAAQTAKILAEELNTTLAITGPVDLVTDGRRMVRVSNGHPLMGSVTGTGCTATAIIGAFAAVDKDPLSASATALSFFGAVGEKAGRLAEAPGTFMIQMLDALYTMTPDELESNCRIETG